MSVPEQMLQNMQGIYNLQNMGPNPGMRMGGMSAGSMVPQAAAAAPPMQSRGPQWQGHNYASAGGGAMPGTSITPQVGQSAMGNMARGAMAGMGGQNTFAFSENVGPYQAGVAYPDTMLGPSGPAAQGMWGQPGRFSPAPNSGVTVGPGGMWMGPGGNPNTGVTGGLPPSVATGGASGSQAQVGATPPGAEPQGGMQPLRPGSQWGGMGMQPGGMGRNLMGLMFLRQLLGGGGYGGMGGQWGGGMYGGMPQFGSYGGGFGGHGGGAPRFMPWMGGGMRPGGPVAGLPFTPGPQG